MAQFHTIKIKDIRQETIDTVSIALDIPENLKQNFKFIQGQYITFKLNINSEEVRRSYSICSGVNDNELRVAVKRVIGGKASNFMADTFTVGSDVSVMEPMGNFYINTDNNAERNYKLFAGGSGITPMLSIIKTILVEEPKSNLTLYYGNRSEASIIFYKELSSLEQANKNLKIYNVLEIPENKENASFIGLMSKENNLNIIKSTCNVNDNNEYFICGPTPMMDAVKETLLILGADSKKLHIEYFSAPVKDVPTTETNGASIDSVVTVTLDGDNFTVNVKANQNILEAVLNAGYDAPYACQGGSCCTCRALVTNGTTNMIVNYALLENEVENGYVLTCQAVPTSKELSVNYDKGK